MYRRETYLTYREVQRAPGFSFGKSYPSIARAFIAHALVTAFPELGKILGKGPDMPWSAVTGYPKMPRLDVLSPAKTQHAALELILENEGSTEGTHNVIDNIFQTQLQWKVVDMDGKLYLCYGDQRTMKNILGAQKEVADEDSPTDRLESLLPVPGLFYFKIAIIDQIKTLF